MSPVNSSSNDAGRESPVRVVRRQLITARGSQEMPTPRVVLHLPDLDALQTVALGPVRPSTRRRIDAAHGVEPTSMRTGRSKEARYLAEEGEEAPASPLLNLLRVPVGKWLAPIASGKLTAGSLVALLQQPKVLLGAIVAVAMQLAAVLAMLGGGSSDKHAPTVASSGSTTPAGAHADRSGERGGHEHPLDQHADHRHGLIRTPLNTLTSDGKPFIGPSLLPAPQALSGVDARDVPPWQAPVATLPPPAANNPATLRSETVAAPALSGPTNATTALPGGGELSAPTVGTGNVVIGRPDISGASNTGPANIVQASSARAKLKGTIQRIPSGGANP